MQILRSGGFTTLKVIQNSVQRTRDVISKVVANRWASISVLRSTAKDLCWCYWVSEWNVKSWKGLRVSSFPLKETNSEEDTWTFTLRKEIELGNVPVVLLNRHAHLAAPASNWLLRNVARVNCERAKCASNAGYRFSKHTSTCCRACFSSFFRNRRVGWF